MSSLTKYITVDQELGIYLKCKLVIYTELVCQELGIILCCESFYLTQSGSPSDEGEKAIHTDFKICKKSDPDGTYATNDLTLDLDLYPDGGTWGRETSLTVPFQEGEKPDVQAFAYIRSNSSDYHFSDDMEIEQTLELPSYQPPPKGNESISSTSGNVDDKFTVSFSSLNTDRVYTLAGRVRDRFCSARDSWLWMGEGKYSTASHSSTWEIPEKILQKIGYGSAVVDLYLLSGYSYSQGRPTTVAAQTTVELSASTTNASLLKTYTLEECASVPKDWGVFLQNVSRVRYTVSLGSSSQSVSNVNVSRLGCHDAPQGESGIFEPVDLSGDVGVNIKGILESDKTSVTIYQGISYVPYDFPALQGFSAVRSDSQGNPDQNGTCLLCSTGFTWSEVEGRNSCSITFSWRRRGTEEWTSVTPENYVSGASVICGDSSISPDFSWEVRATAKDAVTETARTVTVGTADAVMDFKAGGDGVSVGKVSELSQTLDLAPGWSLRAGSAQFTGPVQLTDLRLSGSLQTDPARKIADGVYGLKIGPLAIISFNRARLDCRGHLMDRRGSIVLPDDFKPIQVSTHAVFDSVGEIFGLQIFCDESGDVMAGVFSMKSSTVSSGYLTFNGTIAYLCEN